MLLYIGLVIGAVCGILLGALITQAKISDMELQISVLKNHLKDKTTKKF